MKPSDFTHFLFDLDGTLTDSAPGITASVRYALGEMKIACPPGFDLTVFVGPPLHTSFMKYFSLNDEDADRAVVFYREFYREHGIFDSAVYPGVSEVLGALVRQGTHISLATSKPQRYAEKILAHFGLEEYFEFIHGSPDDNSKSTKADVIRDVLSEYRNAGTENARFLMIGDRREDIAGARECGIESCGALWGYGSAKELSDANILIADIRELIG